MSYRPYNELDSECSAEPMSEAVVSLEHLTWNSRLIAERVNGKARMMGIVKANAYGHGASEIARALEACGVHDFGVANIHEAIALQQSGALRNPALILAFAPPLASHVALHLKHSIAITVCDSTTAQMVSAIAKAHNTQAMVHVKVDTGMRRLGVAPTAAMELLRTIDSLPSITLQGIYTHFADSATDNAFTAEQCTVFKQLTSEYEHASGRTVCKHAANSGAILTAKEAWLDMVRPGILLYGYHPDSSMQQRLAVKPVMQLQSKVIFVKTVSGGTTISYNRRWKAPATRSIATIAIGYADGYLRALSGKVMVFINGKSYPQVGTVTMDQIMVDLGAEPHDVQVGDTAILFGWNGYSADSLAAQANTISYEILCSVSSRVKRRYV